MGQFLQCPTHVILVQSKGSAVPCIAGSEGGAHKWLLLKYGVITLTDRLHPGSHFAELQF